MITLYGISNCDTIKKAKNWLESQQLNYNFHDYKKAGIDETKLSQWCCEFGFERVLNKRSTTWRNLPDADKHNLDEKKAIQIMLSNHSIIKRPILEDGEKKILGFKQNTYDILL